MPITVTAPPTVVEGARSYAEHSGMTLEAFVLKYLESVAMNEQKRLKSVPLQQETTFEPFDRPQFLRFKAKNHLKTLSL